MVVCSYETQRLTHKGGGHTGRQRKDMTDKDKTSRHRKNMMGEDATNRKTQKGRDGQGNGERT